MMQLIVYGLLALIVLAYGIERMLIARDDPREPPRLHSKIPLIGHLVGFVIHGPGYYHTRFQNSISSEVYTIGIANLKIYASTSTRLLPAIQRHSKTLSFAPLLQTIAQKWGGATGNIVDLFGDPDWMARFRQMMKSALAPADKLDEQNLRTANRALMDMEELTRHPGGQINLLEWSRHVITQATSCGVYGINHPFLDPEVEKAWWQVTPHWCLRHVSDLTTGHGTNISLASLQSQVLIGSSTTVTEPGKRSGMRTPNTSKTFLPMHPILSSDGGRCSTNPGCQREIASNSKASSPL